MPAVKGAVFVSYSHKDKKVKDEIVSHLSATPALTGNVFWTDGQIPPGSEWLPQIAENLMKAQVALLLVSQNYLDSKFITRNELQPFLERARNNLVKILWIPISACANYKKKQLAEFQSAWEATEPLERLADVPVARGAVLDKIAETIREALYPKEDFMGFFGDKCLEGAHPAVFLDGKLPQLIDTRLSMVKLSHPPREPISGERCQHCELPLEQALPFEIHQIVPFRELNAVLKLDREFRNFSRHGIKLCLDSEYSQGLPERGCICLGLGFNEITRRLGELSGAYEVYFEPGQTDHFKIRGWDKRQGTGNRLVRPGEHAKSRLIEGKRQRGPQGEGAVRSDCADIAAETRRRATCRRRRPHGRRNGSGMHLPGQILARNLEGCQLPKVFPRPSHGGCTRLRWPRGKLPEKVEACSVPPG